MTGKWKIITESIIGHSHIRKNLPNQDAVYPEPGLVDTHSYPFIAVIADGHGGRDYFRSDRGSQFACYAAALSLSNYYHQDPALSTPHIDEAICKDIHREWKKNILEDIQNFPFSNEESGVIEEGRNSRKYNLPMDPDYEQIRPYGTTILATIITDSYALFFQLGDGDIVTSEGETLFSKVIPADERMVGNETFSLCMPESWRDFKVKRVVPAPDFVMLSTDGYANSFVEDSGFIAAVRDLYSFIYQAEDFDTGVASVRSNLKDWLSVTSQRGSGDDITVCMIARDKKSEGTSRKETLKRILIPSQNKSEPPKSYSFLQNQSPRQPVRKEKKEPLILRQEENPYPLPVQVRIKREEPPVPKKPAKKEVLQPQKKGLSARTIAIISGILIILGLLIIISVYIMNNSHEPSQIEGAHQSSPFSGDPNYQDTSNSNKSNNLITMPPNINKRQFVGH